MRDILVLLVRGYTVRHVRADEDITLERFIELARLRDVILMAPKICVLKDHKLLKDNEDRIFVAFELPKG